ncbi:MAG: YraN family protein [Candidatus Doudnabacteria bacterium]|nr:YraN family protein [Candidatus Doudnabacteria bacterium]
MHKRAVGSFAEAKAAEFLMQKGFEIVEQNFHARWSEIDIIARDKESGEIVFCEVKSVRAERAEEIYLTLSDQKRKRLEIAVQRWLFTNHKQEAKHRLDFIGIVWDENSQVLDIKHFEHI